MHVRKSFASVSCWFQKVSLSQVPLLLSSKYHKKHDHSKCDFESSSGNVPFWEKSLNASRTTLLIEQYRSEWTRWLCSLSVETTNFILWFLPKPFPIESTLFHDQTELIPKIQKPLKSEFRKKVEMFSFENKLLNLKTKFYCKKEFGTIFKKKNKPKRTKIWHQKMLEWSSIIKISFLNLLIRILVPLVNCLYCASCIALTFFLNLNSY